MVKSVVVFPQAVHDFGKSNGVDASFVTEGPSLTRQEFADECDINALMARYEGHVIGGPGNLGPLEPSYVDFSSMPRTLMEYMDFMQQAEGAFMSLPAVVRKEFDNDPRAFVDFASHPDNLDQMRTWGLAAKAPEKAQEPPAAPAAPQAPPAAPAAPAAPTHGPT